jgi:iron(III) transport system ATP-binding protein
MSDLEVRGLVKGFGGVPVLRGVDLTVSSGSVTAILGPSGSGKTTLLRAICGFERAEQGSICIGGEVVDDGVRYVAPERRGIGYVPQDSNLFPHLTVAGNVRFGLPRSADSKARVHELLEMIGLTDHARKYPHQLSGGQQQRVALARALAIDPRLVLLDEPFASLDASLRASVRTEVVTILRAAGATALLVTHDQDEALSMSDTVAVIRNGVIAQLGTPQTVYARPADADLAHFVGEVNLLAGTVDGDAVTTRLGRLPLLDGPASASGESVTVMVRPEQLVLRPSRARRRDRCTVMTQEFYGHDAIVRMTLDADPGVQLIARVRGGATWAPGATAAVKVDGPVVVYSPG